MIELLAPAGSKEAFVAAVENGADAVYLAGNLFGARAYADNFDRETLRAAIRFAHLRGVAVHVTVNTIVGDSEMEALADYLLFLDAAETDAILVQDLGVARVARHVVPNLSIHASTQMTVHNLDGVLALAAMGFSRVVLSREMTLEEIRYICRKSPIEIECFAHGALCVCYSGQCLMSSLIGGRSGNRGRCAQPCRLPYTLMDQSGNDVLGDKAGKYLLSPKDMNTIEVLPELIQAGIASLKIEGRMKRPEYVAVVVNTYRNALNRFYGIDASEPPDEEKRRLKQIFNRDFTTAYLLGNRGKNMMSDRRPNNRGMLIGRVSHYDFATKYVTVDLSANVAEGDELDFWVKIGGRVTKTLKNMQNERGEAVTAGKRGETIRFPLEKTVKEHDRVFRVYDAQLMQKARESFQSGARIRRVPIDFKVRAKIGDPVALSLSSRDGFAVQIISDFVCQKAKKHPATVDMLKSQLSRLGNTVYEMDGFQAELDDVMIPVSVLNGLRRQATDLLDEKRLAPYHHTGAGQSFQSLPACDKKGIIAKTSPLIMVRADSFEKVKAAIESGADGIIFGGDSYAHHYIPLSEYTDALEYVKQHGKIIDFNTPRIVRESSAKSLRVMMEEWKDMPVDAVHIHNIGTLEMAKNAGLPIQSDFSLIAYNTQTLQQLKEIGVLRATLSPELSLRQISMLAKDSPLPLECIVYGRLELMVSAYCVLGSFLGNLDRSVCTAPCRQGRYFLKDRMGAEFPVATDAECNMHILNSKTLSMLPHVMKFAAMGIGRIRIEGGDLSAKDVRRVVAIHRDFINYNEKLTDEQQMRCEAFEGSMFTRGHYFRGVE